MVQREKIFNFSDPEKENIEWYGKILNFRSPETENIDFLEVQEASGRGPGGSPGTFSDRFGGFDQVLRGFWRF